MANYALINDLGIVTQIITGKSETKSGTNWEDFYAEVTGMVVKKTATTTGKSDATLFRKNFASIGSTYNTELDAFIFPKPFNSWLLNQTTCKWEPPTPYPSDGKNYKWDEESLTWIEV